MQEEDRRAPLGARRNSLAVHEASLAMQLDHTHPGTLTRGLHPATLAPRRLGGVVTQRPAKPFTPVRFRQAPLGLASESGLLEPVAHRAEVAGPVVIHLEAWRGHYVGKHDAADPRISPLYADFAGFPPLFMAVGDDELLLDDSLRVQARARAAGVAAEVLVGRRMQHDFPLTLPWLEESREAWGAIVAFLDRVTGN